MSKDKIFKPSDFDRYVDLSKYLNKIYDRVMPNPEKPKEKEYVPKAF